MSVKEKSQKLKINKKIIIIGVIVCLLLVVVVTLNSKSSKDNIINNISENSITNNTSVTPNTEVIDLGKTVIIDDVCEFTIQSAKFGNKIKAPNAKPAYSFENIAYEMKNPENTFLDVIVSIKNLQKTNVEIKNTAKEDPPFVKMKIIYDEDYVYEEDYNPNENFIAHESNNGENLYRDNHKLEPLRTNNYHFVTTVPIEVRDSGKSLKAILTINGKETFECDIGNQTETLSEIEKLEKQYKDNQSLTLYENDFFGIRFYYDNSLQDITGSSGGKLSLQLNESSMFDFNTILGQNYDKNEYINNYVKGLNNSGKDVLSVEDVTISKICPTNVKKVSMKKGTIFEDDYFIFKENGVCKFSIIYMEGIETDFLYSILDSIISE